MLAKILFELKYFLSKFTFCGGNSVVEAIKNERNQHSWKRFEDRTGKSGVAPEDHCGEPTHHHGHPEPTGQGKIGQADQKNRADGGGESRPGYQDEREDAGACCQGDSKGYEGYTQGSYFRGAVRPAPSREDVLGNSRAARENLGIGGRHGGGEDSS